MSNKIQIQECLSVIKQQTVFMGEVIKNHLIEAMYQQNLKQVEACMGSIYFVSHDKDLKGRDLCVVLFEVDRFFKGIELTLPNIESHIENKVKKITSDIKECHNEEDVEALTCRLNEIILMGKVAVGVSELYQAFKDFRNPCQQIVDSCPSFCKIP